MSDLPGLITVAENNTVSVVELQPETLAVLLYALDKIRHHQEWLDYWGEYMSPSDIELIHELVDLAADDIMRPFVTTPIGSILDWMTDTPPEKWLICNGQSVSRATYAELFGVWGVAYGPGDGSTTFNLPDFRFRSPIGAGVNESETVSIGVGGPYGDENRTLYEQHLPEHSHPVTDPGHFHNLIRPGGATGTYSNVSGSSLSTPVNVAWPTQSSTTSITIGSSGDGLPFSIVHPVLGVNRIVYAGQV